MADDFIGYEYYDLTVSKSAASVYIDGYTNFGWNLDNAREMGKFVGKNRVLIKFKRNGIYLTRIKLLSCNVNLILK